MTPGGAALTTRGEPRPGAGRPPCVTTLRTPTTGRFALVGTAWAGATLFGLAVAAETTIGPVLVSLSRNHGVHLGDVVAFGVAYLVALVVTVVALAR